MATAATSIFELFKNNKHHDITFKVKYGNTWSSFPAHRLVLCVWSPVLANKFRTNTRAVDEEYEIVDIRPSTFCAFLNYLYGSAEDLMKNKHDVKFVVDVYEVASKYQVKKLITECSNILISSSPNKDNVFDLIDAALLINSDCLRERCYNVLQSETGAILNSQDLQTVTPSMVMTLLQLPSLWLSSEYELLTWIFKWANSYISKQQNNNHREIISPFLPYLNLTTLESEQFAVLVNNHGEFFDMAECLNIFMDINLPGSTELPVWYNRSRNLRQYKKPKGNVLFGIFAVDNETQTDETMNTNYEEATSSSAECGVEISVASLLPTVDNETQTDETINTNSEEATSSSAECGVEISVASLLPTVDNETQTDETMNTYNEEATSSDGNSSMQLGAEISTALNDSLSMIEETERGQENSAVLKTLDQVPGKSWDSLEPPMHLEKIKKKKIKKFYLLPEGKSLPYIGVWDSELEPSFLSGDFESLSSIIEKQQSLPIAADILSRSFIFQTGEAPCIFTI